MKKYISLIILSVLAITSFIFANDINKEVQVKINGFGLVIGTPANLSLGSVTAGNTIEKTFEDHFWVEDLRGVTTGYYTTIQCDGFWGPDDYFITGVQLKGADVELLEGLANDTRILSNLTDWTDITTPQLYLYKNDNSNNAIFGNRYGNKPSIKIPIPVDAPAGNYKGKITYTLYDMSFSY